MWWVTSIQVYSTPLYSTLLHSTLLDWSFLAARKMFKLSESNFTLYFLSRPWPWSLSVTIFSSLLPLICADNIPPQDAYMHRRGELSKEIERVKQDRSLTVESKVWCLPPMDRSSSVSRQSNKFPALITFAPPSTSSLMLWNISRRWPWMRLTVAGQRSIVGWILSKRWSMVDGPCTMLLPLCHRLSY